jgi:hypothetical protein
MSYNLIILRCSICILFFLLAAAASLPAVAQQPDADHSSQILLMMPFENNSSTPGMDWIGEAFPEVLSTRL